MNTFGKKLLCILFISFISIFAMYKTFTPDQEVSEFENRNLTQKTNLTLSNFIDGTFMQDFEAYFTDQFPGRNTWLKLYTDYQLLSNKTYVSNFYISPDNYIIPKPGYSFDTNQYKRSAMKVNNLGEYLNSKDIELFYVSLPHKATILQFLYPSYIKKGEQKRRSEYLLSQINEEHVIKVDVNDYWEKNFTQDEIKNMFFQTDHHWNIQGAIQAYNQISSIFKEYSNFYRSNNKLSEDYFSLECVPSTKPFVGSYNRQLYMRITHHDNENMCTYIPKNNFADFKVELNGKEIDPFALYGSALKGYENKEKIAYKDIFAGDERNITIINKNNKDAGNILVLKDSYTNPLIFHIAQNFYKTTFYDMRYNQDRTVKEFIEERDYNIVAILYNNTQLSGEFFEFGTE